MRVLRTSLEDNNGLITGGGGTPYKSLYGEAPPERGTFFFGHRSLIRNNTQTAVTNMTKNRMLENKII